MYGRKESLKSRWFGCQKCSEDKVGIFYPTALPTVKMRAAKGLVKLTIECFLCGKLQLFYQLKTFFHSKYLLLPHSLPSYLPNHTTSSSLISHASSLHPWALGHNAFIHTVTTHPSFPIPCSPFSILHSSFLIPHPSSYVVLLPENLRAHLQLSV